MGKFFLERGANLKSRAAHTHPKNTQVPPPPGVIIQSQRTKVNLVPRSTFPPSQQFVTKKIIKKERFFCFKAKRRESSEMTEIPQNNVAFA